MKNNYDKYKSLIGVHINKFIKYKQALGCKYNTEENVLYLFDQYLIGTKIQLISELSSELVNQFITERPRNRPRSYNHLLGVVRRFLNWLVLQGAIKDTLLLVPNKRITSQRIPFIFNDDAAQKLINAAVLLPDKSHAMHRGRIYSLIFGILYNLGLRVGEVSRIQIMNIDMKRNLLIILQTKFSKDRYVPFGPGLAQKLQSYLTWRNQQHASAEEPAFTFDGFNPINPSIISHTFHRLVTKLQLSVLPGCSSPRLHDLRHSFAVNTLLKLYQLGVNPQDKLLHLSTFLGHVDPMSTAVYLQITDGLLCVANQRFEQFANQIFMENQNG